MLSNAAILDLAKDYKKLGSSFSFDHYALYEYELISYAKQIYTIAVADSLQEVLSYSSTTGSCPESIANARGYNDAVAQIYSGLAKALLDEKSTWVELKQKNRP